MTLSPTHKKKRIAINGFGRIGRLCLRAFFESSPFQDDFEIVAVNDLSSLKSAAHLFEFDSVHGRFQGDVSLSDNEMVVGGTAIPFFQDRDPLNLPWKNLGVDIVFECSGVFTSKAAASKHLTAGAKKVIISAPGSEVDQTIVFGVNHAALTQHDHVISNASCTTNCLAPLAKALDETCGIERGFMTTIHGYTGDQRLIDTDHKDLHRARAAALSMIPTSTGAAKAVGLVLPHLKGKIDGTAIRIPTPNVSAVDFTFTAKKPTTTETLNQAFESAAKTSLYGVLAINSKPLVSIDMNHNPHSSIVNLNETQVIDDSFVRVFAWYDNEWGFSNRMFDTAKVLVAFL